MNFESFHNAAEAGLPEDQRRQRPDWCLAATDRGNIEARCSLWWKGVPSLPGERIGCIGHFESTRESAGEELLRKAADHLREAGCSLAVGPMDGNTWRSYRLVTGGRQNRPPFFLEPWNPEHFPSCFRAAGFDTLATYSSSLVPLDSEKDRRLDRIEARLADRQVTIRPIDPTRFQAELDRLYELCLNAFSDNFLYTPIERSEFVAMYGQIEKAVLPDFVLIAESAAEIPVGFVFCIPDLKEPEGKTLIAKTLAVDPRWRSLGLGSVLVERVQSSARALGFTHAIHALQHETNRSRKITGRNRGRKFREYSLFSKPLDSR